MARETLTRDQIVRSAIGLLDEDGLDGLNMRALGKRLDSAATAVYWHVGSKDNLVNLVVDAAWLEIALPYPMVTGWRDAAAMMATGLRSMLERHPWVLHTFGTYLTYGEGKARYDDANIAIYQTAGLVGPQIDQAITTVYTFVLGHALGTAAPASLQRRLGRNHADPDQVIRDRMEEARRIAATFPRLKARLETPAAAYASAPLESFEFGLSAILDGLEALMN